MHEVYIGIGTNIEPRRERMQQAIDSLRHIGMLEKMSSIYETEPYGYIDQAKFLNAVVLLHTDLRLDRVHYDLKILEKKLGRTERLRWHEREIDFDVLFYDDVVLNSIVLTVPHKELQNRSFVLVPLNEIASNFIHPVLKKKIASLLEELEFDKDSIYPIEKTS